MAKLEMETELTAMRQLSEQDQIPTTEVLKPADRSLHPATQRLRVLHFFTRLTLGGMELTALRMISHLDSRLFENQLCGIRGHDPELIALRCPQAEIVSLQEGMQASRTQILSMRRIIRKFRPHIVHSRNWGAIEAVPAARLAGVPVVIHSEHGYEMDSLGGLPFRRRLFRRAAYGMANAVF